MAALKTHLLKALEARRKREAAHLADTVRQAAIGTVAANLAAAAANPASLPASAITPTTPGGPL